MLIAALSKSYSTRSIPQLFPSCFVIVSPSVLIQFHSEHYYWICIHFILRHCKSCLPDCNNLLLKTRLSPPHIYLIYKIPLVTSYLWSWFLQTDRKFANWKRNLPVGSICNNAVFTSQAQKTTYFPCFNFNEGTWMNLHSRDDFTVYVFTANRVLCVYSYISETLAHADNNFPSVKMK